MNVAGCLGGYLAELGISDGYEFTATTMPPTQAQRRAALAGAALVCVAFGALAPFATVRLLRLDSFVPAVESIIFITDLVTAALLFHQFWLCRSRALLLLANGYLFAALVVVPHVLTFPGAFTPRGLLGAGLQSTPWLYIFWHFGFAAALIGYAFLRGETGRQKPPVKSSLIRAICLSVVTVVVLVSALTWLVTAGEEFMPQLILDQVELAPLGKSIAGIDLMMSVAALVLVWTHRRSALDLWLAVTLCALVAELATVSFILVSRYSLGFYLGRIFSLAVSMTVLIMLLSDMTVLYGKFSRTNKALQRKRERQFIKLQVAIIEIAHRVRQPLSGISINAAAARRLLERPPQELDRVLRILAEMESAAFRANEVFETALAQLRRPDLKLQPVDLNEIVLHVLAELRTRLEEHAVLTELDLAIDLPLINGDRGQLQNVLRSLAKNAIDAMSVGTPLGRRKLTITTKRRGSDESVVSVEDTGPGIDPQLANSIFDAFVTTKKSRLGLGLAVTRRTIERHNGRISASRSRGGGARFEIVLPACSGIA